MDDFTRTFKPFFIMGKVMALFPFYLTKNGEIKTSAINLIYSIAIIIAYVFNTNYQMGLMQKYLRNGSVWSKISFQSGSTLLLYYMLVTSIGNLVQRKIIGKGLKSFLQFDEKLSQSFGVKINYDLQRKVSRRLFAISIVGFVSMMLISGYTSQDSSTQYSSTDGILISPLMFVIVAQLVHVMLYIVIINMIRLRIKILNQKVSQVTKIPETFNNFKNIVNFTEIISVKFN